MESWRWRSTWINQRDLYKRRKEHLMCKLKKLSYELKQLPRTWYHRIDLFFINEGFRRSQTDYSSYIKQTNEHLWVVILYMDDLIILASNIIQLNWLKLELNFLLLQNKRYCEKYSAEYCQSHRTLLWV